MKAIFIPFTIDKSIAMLIQSVKSKFGFRRLFSLEATHGVLTEGTGVTLVPLCQRNLLTH